MKKRILKKIMMAFVAVATVIVVGAGAKMDVLAAGFYEPSAEESTILGMVDGCIDDLVDKSGESLREKISDVTGYSNLSDLIVYSNDSSSDIFTKPSTWHDMEGSIKEVRVSIVGDNVTKVVCVIEDEGSFTYNNKNLPPTPPTPTPEPQKEDTKEDKKEPAKPADKDTFKSEEPYGTAGVTNTNSKIGDLKVHKVNATTESNQKFLADAYANKLGKRARILTTVSVHPRRALGVDNGKKEALIYANLEKKVQTVYAVCYNQTDKAYYLVGTLDKDGVATFPDFILRDATNITIFVLE